MTDHITIPIDVAEAAAEAIGNFVSDHGWSDSDMQAMDNLISYTARHKANQAARDKLAKPEPEEQSTPDWANYRQGVADGKAATPAWHDAPTEPGLWMCDEGQDNPYRWTTHSVKFPISPLLVGEDERWFGPIPQDAKAEGRKE